MRLPLAGLLFVQAFPLPSLARYEAEYLRQFEKRGGGTDLNRLSTPRDSLFAVGGGDDAAGARKALAKPGEASGVFVRATENPDVVKVIIQNVQLNPVATGDLRIFGNWMAGKRNTQELGIKLLDALDGKNTSSITLLYNTSTNKIEVVTAVTINSNKPVTMEAATPKTALSGVKAAALQLAQKLGIRSSEVTRSPEGEFTIAVTGKAADLVMHDGSLVKTGRQDGFTISNQLGGKMFYRVDEGGTVSLVVPKASMTQKNIEKMVEATGLRPGSGEFKERVAAIRATVDAAPEKTSFTVSFGRDQLARTVVTIAPETAPAAARLSEAGVDAEIITALAASPPTLRAFAALVAREPEAATLVNAKDLADYGDSLVTSVQNIVTLRSAGVSLDALYRQDPKTLAAMVGAIKVGGKTDAVTVINTGILPMEPDVLTAGNIKAAASLVKAGVVEIPFDVSAGVNLERAAAVVAQVGPDAVAVFNEGVFPSEMGRNSPYLNVDMVRAAASLLKAGVRPELVAQAAVTERKEMVREGDKEFEVDVVAPTPKTLSAFATLVKDVDAKGIAVINARLFSIRVGAIPSVDAVQAAVLLTDGGAALNVVGALAETPGGLQAFAAVVGKVGAKVAIPVLNEEILPLNKNGAFNPRVVAAAAALLNANVWSDDIRKAAQTPGAVEEMARKMKLTY